MENSKEGVDVFFDNCETGKGWTECSAYCTENATFHCDVLPMKTLQEYTDWMKGLITGIAPDGKYELLSRTTGTNQVVYCAVFKAHHTLNGGPVPPSEPPKYVECDYAYIIDLDSNSKIKHMRKIWDQGSAFKQWGWV